MKIGSITPEIACAILNNTPVDRDAQALVLSAILGAKFGGNPDVQVKKYLDDEDNPGLAAELTIDVECGILSSVPEKAADFVMSIPDVDRQFFFQAVSVDTVNSVCRDRADAR